MSRKEINIVTPIVWAGAETIRQYTFNINNLMKELNNIAQKHHKNIEIKNAVIDIYSITQGKLANYADNLEIMFFNTSIKERKSNGMAYWWYAAVRRAFDISSSIDYVLYYPIDTCWDNTEQNIVANPIKIYEMLKFLLHEKDKELLVIGNYISSNKNKEKTEIEIRALLKSKYPNLDSNIFRVRSEFWAINRKLFNSFERACLKNNNYTNIADPSLLIILYCLREKIAIIPYNLGSTK